MYKKNDHVVSPTSTTMVKVPKGFVYKNKLRWLIEEASGSEINNFYFTLYQNIIIFYVKYVMWKNLHFHISDWSLQRKYLIQRFMPIFILGNCLFLKENSLFIF